jgi:succinylarginine dihydrolase
VLHELVHPLVMEALKQAVQAPHSRPAEPGLSKLGLRGFVSRLLGLADATEYIQ